MPPSNNRGRGRGNRWQPYADPKPQKDRRSVPQKMKDALEKAKAALSEYQEHHEAAYASENARRDDLDRYPKPGVAYTFDHIISWVPYLPDNYVAPTAPTEPTLPAVQATTEEVPRSLSPVEEPAVARQQTKVAPTTEKNKGKFHGGHQKGKKNTDKGA